MQVKNSYLELYVRETRDRAYYLEYYRTQKSHQTISQSINLFSQLCNNKNKCQQNNVKHSDGLREKQIAHLSWSPK